MKKILFLATELENPRYTGGIQVYNRFFLRALRELGHEVRVISANDTPEDVKDESIVPCNLPLRKFRFAMASLRQALTFGPDLIICGHVNFSLLALLLASLLRRPYYTVGYGIDLDNVAGLRRLGLERSDKTIVISRHTRALLSRQLGDSYRANTVSLIPPSFDQDKFKPEMRSKALMAKLGITEGEKVLLTVSRLSKSEGYKGYDKVIESLRLAKGSLPALKYVIAGTGDDLPRLETMLRESGLGSKVILAGFVPGVELPEYYNLCDVFVMPSKREGFGIVFLEALACGKPVIAGKLDGSVDAVLDGEVGELVDPEDAGDITRALRMVLSPEGPRPDGTHLRRRVIEEFGFDGFKEKVRLTLEN